MRVLALLIAPVLLAHADSYRLFGAGVLNCGIVMRGVDEIQRYCYSPSFPALKLVLNTRETIYDEMSPTYQWCVNRTDCTSVGLAWIFKMKPGTGIGYEVTVIVGTAQPITYSGTLTSIYGAPVAAQPVCGPWRLLKRPAVFTLYDTRQPSAGGYMQPQDGMQADCK